MPSPPSRPPRYRDERVPARVTEREREKEREREREKEREREREREREDGVKESCYSIVWPRFVPLHFPHPLPNSRKLQLVL